MEIKDVSIGFIGCGMMGGALAEAMAKAFPAERGRFFVSDADAGKARTFAERTGVTALPSNAELASRVQYLFLAVKPAFLSGVVAEVAPSLGKDTVVVSIAAGVTLGTLRQAFAGSGASPHLVRVMPNLPATVGEAMIALCPATDVGAAEAETVRALLGAAGKVELVAERLMDGVTAVSGSGPAYAFLFIEALADAAVRFGIPRPQAYTYAAQTLKGSAELAMRDGRSISELKDAVCSPAGTTIEAVASLERDGFRSAIIEAATAAYNKSVELGKH